MSTKMLQSASMRLKNSHALVASLILAVAGSTMIVSPAMAQHSRGGDRQQDAGSGMSRMGNMGRGSSGAPSAPRATPAPAPRVSAPPPAPRSAPAAAPAPRMSAPAPAPRMSSPAPSISSPPPAARVMPEPGSRSGSGGSPILRMRPADPPQSVAPAPRQSAPPPRQVAPAPRIADAPRQPTSPAPSMSPRSRTDVGGAPINRMRPADAVTSTPNRPRSSEAINTPDRAVEIPRSGPRASDQQSRDLRSNLRTAPTPGSPIMQVRGNDSRPSTPPSRDDRGPRDGRDGRDGRGNDGRDGRGGDGRGDWNGRDGRDGRWNDRDGRNWNGRDGRNWGDGRNNWDGRGNNWNGHNNWNWHGNDNWRHNNNWHGNSWNNWNWNNWNHRHHHSHSSFLVAPSLFYSTWPYYYSYGYGSGVNWGLGFSWGSSSLYYNSYCAPRYYTYSDPLCIYPSYYRSRYYSYPLSYSLYYPPSYIDSYSSYYPSTTTYTYYDEPAYTDTYYYGSTLSSANNGLIDYSSKAPASMGGYTSDVYVNNGYAPAPSSVAQGTPAESAEPIMVYRASKDQGQLVWSDTPTNIVNNLFNATSDRAQVAQRYLGKTLAGGWEVTLDEIRKTTDGGTVLTTRGTASSGTGSRPTIVVQVPRSLTGLEVGQRLSVTGRLTELSVNDPDNAGGLLVLEEGDASW